MTEVGSDHWSLGSACFCISYIWCYLIHANNTSLGLTYHLQDVQSESQNTENGTILGDLWRLGSWHYSVEWLAWYATVCLLLLQLFCIYEYHLSKMLVQLHTNTLMHLHMSPPAVSIPYMVISSISATLMAALLGTALCRSDNKLESGKLDNAPWGTLEVQWYFSEA